MHYCFDIFFVLVTMTTGLKENRPMFCSLQHFSTNLRDTWLKDVLLAHPEIEQLTILSRHMSITVSGTMASAWSKAFKSFGLSFRHVLHPRESTSKRGRTTIFRFSQSKSSVCNSHPCSLVPRCSSLNGCQEGLCGTIPTLWEAVLTSLYSYLRRILLDTIIISIRPRVFIRISM